jgi:hypothetical protein
MEDAVFHGWEPVKQAHSVILSSLESRAFTWDELKMAKKRRSAITRTSQQVNIGQSSGSSFVQNSKVTGQGRWQGKPSNNSGPWASNGKKIIKSCLYFNNNICAKKDDHDEGNIFFKHNCSHCMATDHTVKECSFLNSIM